MAEIGFLATCVVTPFWVVDFILDEATILTRFYTSEEEAEEAAKNFAFDGVLKNET
jgi:Uri superfamily endonuclease